jgi:hypothetical protein
MNMVVILDIVCYHKFFKIRFKNDHPPPSRNRARVVLRHGYVNTASSSFAEIFNEFYGRRLLPSSQCGCIFQMT